MINTNDADATRFEFPLTEKSNRTGQRLLLGKADIKELPVIAKCVLALLEFLPNVLEPTISLEGSCILVYVAPSLSAPANMTANDAHATCIDAVDTLTMTATEIMHNSERAKPLPLNAVVTHKNASSLLRALASGDEGRQFSAKLKSFCAEIPLPILTPAEFTSADPETNQRKTGTFRVVGLIRGDQGGGHQFVLGGGLRVNLPGTSRWKWTEIHDVLDYEAHMVGTLIRESASDAWSISDDTHIQRQPPLL
ncbi:hypothetical protein AB7849_18795 [Rhodanobacter sp. 115]|uniref:hypothetical protein n=1 Tax=Rhodanobacter sp. FW021-MT20 TaxID=1162282 RepID=UPI0034E562F0